MAKSERIVVAHWEGPYPWSECQTHRAEEHVLYAIHGSHHLYGRDVLLYIGKSDGNLKRRLGAHEDWVADEYDDMSVRFASVGPFDNWATWNRKGRYSRPTAPLIAGVECLLIRAHQPAYNSSSKASIPMARDLRVMNTGRLGHLLPEVSYLYHGDD